MKKTLSLILLIIIAFSARATFIKKSGNSTSNFQFRSANCKAPTSRVDLDINNVRTTILNGGDLWWDLDNAKYEIPKGSGKHSIFAGSIMIGGVDETGNLKMAALTHRDGGTDFWAGPIDQNSISTTSDVCEEYDKHYKLNKKDIEEYVTAFIAGESPPIPPSMQNYPAHGDVGAGHDYYLAPFFDADSNGTYDPSKGDYPAFDLGGNNKRYANGKLRGDQNIWWVFNDVGNIHTESGANAIGLEIQAQAFGFSTNDDVNNMTFYNYKIINRSTFTINDCYMGVWADTDLGYAFDDYVGCDVERGLGYCYNGDANDETGAGYGNDPPAVGIDFFEGPTADVFDGIDNDRDGVIDEEGELISMSKFVYYNIGAGDQGDPNTATDYYNYIRGRWKNNSPMEYAGNGFNSSGIACDFMFPDDSDQEKYWGTKGVVVAPWNESNAGNAVGDRRFIQSAGPFTLEPGAVNFITTGVVWAQATPGEGAWSAVQNLKAADDLAQALFDNDFQILNGPDAPDLVVQEMQNELIFYIENSETSNNYKESYEELDPSIVAPLGINYDSLFKFQGYQVYQLKKASVSSSELGDATKARLVWQSDIEDGVGRLVNQIYDNDIGFDVPTIMVNGKDEGVEHSFSITKDLFATGDDRLINHKEYHYMVVAYAFNNYLNYANGNGGQKTPFKAGRRNIKTYSVVPHDASIEGNGTNIQSGFGMSPKIKRISGIGNGGRFVNLSKESINAILTSSNHKINEPEYSYYGSPVGVKVIDPVKVPNGDFRFELLDTVTINDLSDAYWMLLFKGDGESNYDDTIFADRSIDSKSEQIISKWGLSVKIKQVGDVGASDALFQGVIADSVQFENPALNWLSGIEDVDGDNWSNWIRAGIDSNAVEDHNFNDYYVSKEEEDTDGDFEKIANGWIAPFKYASRELHGPSVTPDAIADNNEISELNNVDLVFTNDKANWSICPVLERADDDVNSEFGDNKLSLRRTSIKDWNGYELSEGLGYFPGYAIDVLTGERLNIAYAENSFLPGDNGADMLWNPTDVKYDDQGAPIFGGMHSIYIFSTKNEIPKYDKGQTILNIFNDGAFGKMTRIFNNCTWVFANPLRNLSYDLLATDLTIKLRVNEPYESTGGDLPVYEFNTADIYAKSNETAQAKINLDKVNVVPNPYYGFSEYEKSKLSNEVKITNLPKECTVKIFTLDGTLVKTLKKDNDDLTSIAWNVKNDNGIAVASGFYIFHINAPGVGKKIIKWFGVQREIDLDTF
ncbi:MAG: hypothetical protein ACI9U0_000427 [Flavobacteriales bacterium]|jgi:hypothetical protein|tara:strand:+ start:1238 stop:4999 length:3762 start_codon:yes stop_codon:yes gene_type:complete